VRLGPGPVFAYEWLTTTRRWQLYALRTGFIAAILIGMMVVWHNSHRLARPGQTVSIQALATYGENLYETIVSIELTLVILAAPAATAGAVCLDKARGTLDHMLATDLSNAEIVLGKIGVRLVPVLGLIACVLPLTALTSLLGGIDPLALFGSFMTSIACAALGCSLAMTVSVWGRKTHEVLMITYLILVIWLISPILLEFVADSFGLTPLRNSAPTLWGWIACSNPYYLAFAPYSDPGKVGLTTYLGFLAVCLLFSALLLSLATVRIRGVALLQAGRQEARARISGFSRHFPTLSWWPVLPGPSLDRNPILWREWHRSKPSRLLRVVWALYSSLGFLWIVLALQVVASARNNQETIAIMSMVQVSLGLLLLSVSAATSLAEERVRGSLDVLLCTPLSTRSILVGKWWGSFRQSSHVLVWPMILAGILVAESGRWISYVLLLGLVMTNSAVITSLGLVMATWVNRLGRAVALCVSAYIVFSIGWVLLILLLAIPGPSNDHFLIPMVMGSPFYGTIFATMAVAPGDLHFPGGAYTAGLGAFIWIVIDGAIALLLFLTALATFDRCLGRVSEVAGRSKPFPKKPTVVLAPDLDEWLVENSAEISRPAPQ
jgi:ABC-type transport system involved in multi-copper enzyme maturation permease subunit